MRRVRTDDRLLVQRQMLGRHGLPTKHHHDNPLYRTGEGLALSNM